MSTAASLPPFSRHWVGGDIWGLQTLAERCDAVEPEINGVATALSRVVGQVAAAGSWRGRAADSFISRWDTDSRAGRQLASAWTSIGKVIGELAAVLASLESRLEEAADQLERQGIAVDQSDGTPLPDVVPGGHANVAPQRMAADAHLAAEYSGYRAQVLNAAQTAREAAAAQLGRIAGELIPAGRDWGQLSTDADALRSLWGIPTAYRTRLQGELSATDANLTQTERSALRFLVDNPGVNGSKPLLPQDMRTAISEVQAEKGMLESKLGFVKGLEPASSKVASGDADALGLTGDGTSGLMRVAGGVVRAIPLAGTAAGTGITLWQDLKNHKSIGYAAGDAVTSNAAGLAGGMGVSAGTAAFAAGIIGAGPEVAVTSGVIAGGVAAVGVGDFVHNMWQEHWGPDWNHYGVLGGTGHGIADTFDTTRHDMAHDADDIKNFFS